MSRKGGSRQHWNNIDWDAAFSTGPAVVNATLNSITNEFEVSRPPPSTRSRFDFSSNQPSTSWINSAQAGWNTNATEGSPVWSNKDVQQEDEHHNKFSTKDFTAETTTFRLNFDIDETPTFSKVTDYSSFRKQNVVPDFDDVIINPELKDPEEWANVTHRDPFPEVPVNRIKQPYDSVEQYLYTHFELMRQDFLIPLQNAVKSYKEVYHATKDADDVGVAMENSSSYQKPYRLYEHVGLNAIVFGIKQPLYRISFRLPYYVRVNWAQSKRLMPGTLVLLSRDHFEKDLKIATIVERGEEPLRGPGRFEYLLDLYLERDNEDQPLGFGDPSLSTEDTYVMLEATDGYFEAYRHVLNVLQKTSNDGLPFSQYLVELSNNVLVPHYAARKRYYDINVRNNGRGKDQWAIDIFNEWPRYPIGMDDTQTDALRTILSHNLSIVQGPPGTGKTYVGTYAMRILLNNFGGGTGPIVCICQTNHALDQFLEHIYGHSDKIVRVGGRSKSDILKENTLYELKKAHERPRGIGRLYRARDKVSQEIKSLIVEMYEQPCVTIEYIESIKGLRDRQIGSLRYILTKEKNRKNTPNTTSSAANRDDSDDDWEISSVQPVAAPKPPPVPTNKNQRERFSRNPKASPKTNARNDWAGGNPNHIVEIKEKEPNPVEIWLQEAIEYIDNSGVNTSLAEEMKQNFLDQDKGLVIEEDTEERDLIEEEEFLDVQQAFRGEELDTRNKSPYIQIGRAYQKQTETAPGENPGRKIINYNKSKPATTFNTQAFSFFDDNKSNDINDEEEEHTKYSLERWRREDDVSMWPLPVRLKAHKEWADRRRNELQSKLNACMRQYQEISDEIRRLTAAYEAKICRANYVVGMTSTAAAKYHDLLQEIRPKIMVVEEAAEMLESHIITALTDSLEHLILIGDHQQLRPSTAVHELSENHALGVSLFERLVMNQFPFTRLSHQRRMRPEIRALINPIYKDPPLNDHPDVYKYPPIRGMEQSMFFLAHNQDETHMNESASKINEHEAVMAAKLSVYLMLQGYKAEEITIITMYSGQKTMIKRALREERRAHVDPEPILVSSVDGYQGEENKIIILSLVRSNANGQIGFLKVANRVCVSLSRAQHGLYILGNARLLCERSDLWNEIVGNIEDNEEQMIGTKITLKCEKHQTRTEVQWPVDFVEVEGGGCNQICGETLPCGHKCTLKCHSYDHEDYRCKLKCEKVLPCKHVCIRRCCEDCKPCIAPISVRLPCGDMIDAECHVIRNMALNPKGKTCPQCNAPLDNR
ncbi:NFX1-type zinc finger-containing protein 1 [Choanephora cucurbitarum]|uniref:NFX1-type zinc finger-containing protein 1 n=1 Tax=Choanephora cucurbitarum TaxID=101091 RepID=A0A1C7NKC6_9FUNG|nr:NFX1-type zinc finger-containing protein 1 [Choanephora cucurbitarum]